MKHKAELVLGTSVLLAGVLVLFYEYRPIIPPFGSSVDRPGYIGDVTLFGFLFGILLIFGGFVIVYYFVFRKWELEHGAGELAFKSYRNVNLWGLGVKI